MTEAEVNALLDEIGKMVADGVRRWKYDGTIGTGIPHQIIPAPETTQEDSSDVFIYPNHTGVVGPRATSVFSLDEFGVPVPITPPQPAYDGSFRRVASQLDFSADGNDMRIYINDLIGRIGALSCIEVNSGDRPHLTATGTAKYALFKRAICLVVVTGGTPIYDVNDLWEYVLIETTGVWIPTSTFAETAPGTNIFYGELYVQAWPNKIGFYNYNGNKYFVIDDPSDFDGFNFTVGESSDIVSQNPDFGFGPILDRTLGHPPSGATLWSGAFYGPCL